MREGMFLLLAVVVTYIVSAYIVPWYVSPDLLQGSGQAGWPMAYWMKIWGDLGNNKGFEKSTFDFLSLVIDIVLFYLVIRLASLGIMRVRKQ